MAVACFVGERAMEMKNKILLIVVIIFVVGFLFYNDAKPRSDDRVETWREFCQVLNTPPRKGFFFTTARMFEAETIRKEFTSYLNFSIKN